MRAEIRWDEKLIIDVEWPYGMVHYLCKLLSMATLMLVESGIIVSCLASHFLGERGSPYFNFGGATAPPVPPPLPAWMSSDDVIRAFLQSLFSSNISLTTKLVQHTLNWT